MTAPSAFVLALGRLLDPAAWPRDFFGPPAWYGVFGNGDDDVFEDWLDDLFDRVHITDYRALDARPAPPPVPGQPPPAPQAAFGYHVDLWVRGPVAFGLNGFYGFEFVAGGATDTDWVRIPTTVLVGERFEVMLHRVDLRVRLPRDVFRLPMERANAFADDPFRVEIPITGSIRVDASFDVKFLQEAPASFGPIEVLESGFLLTVDNALFDLSRDQQEPEIAQAGLPEDFRGFFSQKVTVSLPTYLDPNPEQAVVPGEVPRTVEFFMENVGIGTGGLHGTIGVRQTLTGPVPVAERPTVTALDSTTLLYGTPGDLTSTRGDFRAGETAYAIGKSVDGLWFLVQPARYEAVDRAADVGGPAWVEGTRVRRFGNFNLLPVLANRTTDTFEAGGFLTIHLGSVPLRFEQFFITFKDSVPVDFGIRASLLLKDFLVFKGDEMLQVTLSVDSKLAFSLRLATVLPPDPMPDPSRFDTFKVAGDVIIIRVDGLEFSAKRVEKLGVEDPEWKWQVLLDCTVFFRWSFTERNAEAGKQRAVSLKGLGVKDPHDPVFPTAAKVTLASDSGDDAFKQGLEIKGLAFSLDSVGAGVDSGGAAYLSLAGSIAHFTGFKAKGTLGLRFRWRDGEFLGVAFDKAALKVASKAIEGELEVEFVDEAVPTPTGFEQREGWRGKGRFKLKTPPKLFVYLEAAFGEEPVNHAYFVLDVGSTSSGVPAGPIAFYGITGLAGFNFVPDKRPEQRWYEDWFRDKSPKMNAVAVTKWRPEKDGEVLGLGTIIGTSGDKGYRANAKVVFIHAKPGPVVIFAGHGNILSSLDELDHPERAMLAVLVVYDGGADTLSIAAQMKYQTPQDGTLAAQKFGAGSLYSTSGLVDAFFDLSRSDAWHVYLGERSPEKRIRAEFVKHFRVDGYLMIDPSMIELGVSVGWDWRKKWGPLRAELAIWIEGVAGYIYEPDQVFGSLRLGGRARLSAFGFGLGVTLGADVTVGGPTPRFYHFVLVFKMEMPWFLPDINVKAEFGDRDDKLPPSPLALRSVAVTHDQPVADFPASLHPNLDPDGDGLYIDPVSQAYDELAALAAAPLVPLDAKPVVAFGHPFNDRTGVVENPTGVLYKEAFGDEGFFRYDLTRVQLEKRPRGSASVWTLLDDRSEANPQPPVDWSDYDGELHVFGHTRLRAKLLVDASSGENLPIGLRFWAKTPFNVHLAGDEQVEGTVDVDPNWPCVDIPPKPAPECADYSAQVPGTPLPPSSRLGRVSVQSPAGGRVILVDGTILVGRFGGGVAGSRLRFSLPERARWVRVSFLGRFVLDWWAGREGRVTASAQGETSGEVLHTDDAGIDWIEILDPTLQPEGPALALASLRTAYFVHRVCFEPWTGMAVLDSALDAADQAGQAFPAGVDVQAETVLEPDQDYRLTLATEVLYSEDGVDWQARESFTQRTYLKTAGPPGLFPSSTLLKDLAPYVHHSAPAAGATPVYRGYDVRVAFRDDAAIRGMYSRSLETLRLEVSDGSEGLAASADGRPQLVAGSWARDPRIAVATQLGLWRGALDRSPCFDPGPHGGGDVVVATPIEPLRAERNYRASLLLASSPTLRRHRFTPADLVAMTPVEGQATGGPGRWEVDAGRLVQRRPTRGPATPGVSTRAGPMLLVGAPTWRNYRVTAAVDAPGGTVGLVAGFLDADNHYLAAFDTDAGTVELVRVLGGNRSRLALQSPPALPPGAFQVTLTFTGEWLEVAVGDERLEPVLESSLPRGRCGVFTAGAEGAAFSTLTVSGVSLYDVDFTTSRYTDFVDHVGSYRGRPALLVAGVALGDVRTDVAAALARFPAASDASEGAQRARGDVFASLLAILGLPDGEPAGDVDVTLVQGTDGSACWLLESPEPLWWRDRTSLTLARQEWVFGGRGRFEVDPDTLRRHRDGHRLRTKPPGGPGRVLPDVVSRNLGALRLSGVDVDDKVGSHLEFLATAGRDLSGTRIQLRVRRDDFLDWFTFPRLTVAPGERLRIYEDTDARDLPPSRPGRRVFATTATGMQELARAGTVVRVLNRNGIIEEIIPLHPIEAWVDVDPGRLRLVHTADTRKALLFVAGPMGLPETLPAGDYRMTLTFLRDLGTPESTWSHGGDSSPEVATLVVTVPPAPSA